LRKSENEWVRLDEEIEFVRSYLSVEQSRFGDRLAVNIEIDPACGAVSVPAMCVQPLVENAIKHGTSKVEGQGRVSIRANLDGDLLIVEVCDNGPGFPPGAGNESLGRKSERTEPHGLGNIRDRLSGYYGCSASLDWRNEPDGARVSLKIPRNGLRSDASSNRR
jgi:LytS/YehU family sensor histidine kinase